MPKNIYPGDFVQLPDGKIAGVRDIIKEVYRVRVRRKSSKSHQFFGFQVEELKKIACPKGWMSPEGHN